MPLRKKTRAKPIIRRVNPQDGGVNEHDFRIDTGIYSDGLTTAFVAVESLDTKLARIEQTARGLLDESTAELRECPDQLVQVGPYRYSKCRESPAWYLRNNADLVLRQIEELRANLADANAQDAAVVALALGQSSERLFVRQREHLALIGLRKSARNRDIANGRRLTDDERRARYEAVQAELQKQAKRDQRINRDKAYDVVAKRLGLSKRTVSAAFLAIDRG